MEHKLKILEDFADAVLSGEKCFEIRKNDRGFNRGDTVRFSVVRRDGITPFLDHPLNGYEFAVTYVLSGWGIEPGYVALGLRMLPYA